MSQNRVLSQIRVMSKIRSCLKLESCLKLKSCLIIKSCLKMSQKEEVFLRYIDSFYAWFKVLQLDYWFSMLV